MPVCRRPVRRGRGPGRVPAPGCGRPAGPGAGPAGAGTARSVLRSGRRWSGHRGRQCQQGLQAADEALAASLAGCHRCGHGWAAVLRSTYSAQAGIAADCSCGPSRRTTRRFGWSVRGGPGGRGVEHALRLPSAVRCWTWVSGPHISRLDRGLGMTTKCATAAGRRLGVDHPAAASPGRTASGGRRGRNQCGSGTTAPNPVSALVLGLLCREFWKECREDCLTGQADGKGSAPPSFGVRVEREHGGRTPM